MQNETSQKLLVCVVSFSSACAGFALSLLVLIPVLGSLMLYLHIPALIQQSVILGLLFVPTIVAALMGINVADRIIESNSKAST